MDKGTSISQSLWRIPLSIVKTHMYGMKKVEEISWVEWWDFTSIYTLKLYIKLRMLTNILDSEKWVYPYLLFVECLAWHFKWCKVWEILTACHFFLPLDDSWWRSKKFGTVPEMCIPFFLLGQSPAIIHKKYGISQDFQISRKNNRKPLHTTAEENKCQNGMNSSLWLFQHVL